MQVYMFCSRGFYFLGKFSHGTVNLIIIHGLRVR